MALGNRDITVTDVSNTLGVNITDVGSLCKNNKVNQWSKWKPIRCNNITLTDDILEDNNWGITLMVANTPAQLLSLVQGNNNLGFIYDKPTALYRLGDFRNYEHNSKCPINEYYSSGDIVDIGNVSSSYEVGLYTIDGGNIEGALTVMDLYPNMNRGIYLTDGATSVWSTTTIPYGKNLWQKFKGVNNVKALEFMTNIPANTDSTEYLAQSTDIFTALPYPLHTIKITGVTPAGSGDVFVNGAFNYTDSSYNVIEYSFCFSSIGSTYVGGILNNVWIGLYADADCTDVIATRKLEDMINIGSEATSPLYTGTFTNRAGNSTAYIGIWWNNSLQYKKVPLAQNNGGDIIV